MGNQAVGEAFFAKVAEIWYRYLKNFFDKIPEEQETFLIEQFSLEEAINYLVYIESTANNIQSISKRPTMRTNSASSSPQ